MKSHHLNCVLLKSANQALLFFHQQILDHLYGKLHIKIDMLFDIIDFTISKVWNELEPSMRHLYSKSFPVTNFDESLKALKDCKEVDFSSSLSCKMIDCGILVDSKKGRFLCARKDIQRGRVLLMEEPKLIATNICTLGCSFEKAILPEHISIALKLMKDNIDTKFFCSGLSHQETSVAVTTQEQSWPFRTTCFIMTTCIILSKLLLKNAQNDKMVINELLNTNEVTNKEWTLKLFKVLCRVPNNVHAISRVITTTKTGVVDGGWGQVDTVESRREGLAIFTNASSVNHSCVPNASIRYQHEPPQLHHHQEYSGQQQKQEYNQNNRCKCNQVILELVATEDIAAGDEICISYGGLPGLHSTQRREMLRDQYNFTCDCKACTTCTAEKNDKKNKTGEEEEVDPEVGFQLIFEVESLDQRCLEVAKQCRELLVHTTSNSSSSSSSSSGSISGTSVESFNAAVSFMKAAVEPTVDHIRELISRHFPNGTDPSMLDHGMHLDLRAMLCRLTDLAAEVYSRQGKYLRASEFVKEGIDALSWQVRSDDPIIARERIKLGQLLFNAGDLQNSYEPLTRGATDLALHVSSDDVDIKEAHMLLLFLQRIGNKSNSNTMKSGRRWDS